MTGPSAPSVPTPSGRALAKATGTAFVSAMVLLVFVVLPAEFNIDPTGFGGSIGLTALSSPAPEASAGVLPKVVADEGLGHREDRVAIEVAAGKGLEYKFSIRAGDKMTYSWQVDAGHLAYDFHGEPTNGERGFFESYVVASGAASKGTFTAPFDGSHGWYWENTRAGTVTVTLETSGTYQILGLQ